MIIKASLYLGLVVLCLTLKAQDSRPASSLKGWALAAAIKKQIVAPVFPARLFPVTDFGAVGDGKTICTMAIAKAIKACNKAGGGKVLVPTGVFYTGPIHLKSNVELHLEKGAKLLFSTDPQAYLPMVYTRWEGVELMNYSPLIYAFKQTNIAVTGDGILDGGASSDNWWPWKGLSVFGWKEHTPNQKDSLNRPTLFKMGEGDKPVSERKFGEGHYLRPQFVQPYACKNVLIAGVTIINSPMWVLHPVLCENVTIDKVTVKSDGPNTDGCDPESCTNVWIKNCFFNTGDDCIAIKSGRNRDGRRINAPCQNILIQDCTMANGHGGIVIGSEISGGVRNLFAERCNMSSPLLERALRIKSSSARGGITENIYLRNIEVGRVKEQAIIATMFYEDSGKYVPVFRNIEIRDMHVRHGGNIGIVLEGYPQSPVKGFRLINVDISGTQVPFYFSNTAAVSFKNVKINGKLITDTKHHLNNPSTIKIAR